MDRIKKGKGDGCGYDGNSRCAFRSNKPAKARMTKMSRSERKELDERNKIYDSPNYLIPSERKYVLNYRKDRQMSEPTMQLRSSAKRGAKIAKNGGKSPAWQRKEGKNPSGGLNAKGVASYRAANPGSKLKTAVTTKPSKLKPGSKAASRRKSFCSRMSGMKKKLTSAKTANDPNSRINKSLRKWNC